MTRDGIDQAEEETVNCGRVVRWRVDKLRRTLFLQTTTHGLTLEWEGGHGKQDEPIPGSKVELHWGEQATFESKLGLKWVSVRRSYPEGTDTARARLTAALSVGISAALSTFALMTLGRVLYLSFGTAVLETGPGGAIFEVVLLFGSAGALMTWRELQRRILERRALGVKRLAGRGGPMEESLNAAGPGGR